MPENAIGQKIKYYRQQKGLTQQDLELELGLSPGHVSRIESGKINPTKNTLLQISHILQLNKNEQSYLLGITSGRVSESDIRAVRNYMTGYLKKKSNPVNITDDTWFVHDWNIPMYQLFDLDAKSAENYRGTHALKLLFDPKLPFRKTIPQQYWPIIATYQIAFFQRETALWENESWRQELIKDLHQLKDFSIFWEQATKLKSSEINPEEKIFICTNPQGEINAFHVADYRIDKYPRFSLIEYIQIDPAILENHE